MTRAQKLTGIIICVIGAVALAWLSLEATDSYWIYLVLAGLLGVAAGVIRNLPDKPDHRESTTQDAGDTNDTA